MYSLCVCSPSHPYLVSSLFTPSLLYSLFLNLQNFFFLYIIIYIYRTYVDPGPPCGPRRTVASFRAFWFFTVNRVFAFPCILRLRSTACYSELIEESVCLFAMDSTRREAALACRSRSPQGCVHRSSYSGRGLPSLDPALLSVGGPWGMGMGRTYVRPRTCVHARIFVYLRK